MDIQFEYVQSTRGKHSVRCGFCTKIIFCVFFKAYPCTSKLKLTLHFKIETYCKIVLIIMFYVLGRENLLSPSMAGRKTDQENQILASPHGICHNYTAARYAKFINVDIGSR